MKIRRRLAVSIFIFTLVFCGTPLQSFSQYILNGSATQDNCNCYTLTQAVNWQGGSVWNSNKINLSNAFDFWFNVYLGCLDATGADGIVFILQPISTSLGASGGGMGFLGMSPSVGIALDTWQNTEYNDPAYDHISIQANGNIAHGNDLAGPVQIINGVDNVEDCSWHVFRISWDPVSKMIRGFFDGVLRVEAQVDLITSIFSGDPNVYWGFAGATGGAYNLQQFCTALNPGYKSNLQNGGICFGNPVTFRDSSISFAPVQSWYWDFGDGTTSTLKDPPQHLYSAPGSYELKMAIKGLDGCVSDTLRKTISIGTKPQATFTANDTCFRKPVLVNDLSTNQVGTINQWTWLLEGLPVSNSQLPDIINTNPGTNQLQLVVKSVYGCQSDTATGSFIIKPVPQFDVAATSGCLNKPISFSATQTDNQTNISQWNWNLGDGTTSQIQNPSHTYTQAGNVSIQTSAVASNGCVSEPVIKAINVVKVSATALNDTTILPNIPFQLSVEYGGNFINMPSFNWSPSIGLTNPAIRNPSVILQDDQTYIVTVATAEGCVATDTVNIKVFKGSAVYVPTGFTPNQDGRNDFLRGLYIGIKKVDYFRVYNRWGQAVFSTNSLSAGWDGTINGVPQPTGSYVWMLRAEDLAGKIYEMKGVTTLIR